MIARARWPGCLRGPRSSVEAAEAIRLFLDRGFELDERVRRPVGFEQHVAEQLARRCERARRDGRFVGGVFGRRRGAQQLDAARLVAFRERDPRDRDLALDVDLLGPVGVRHRLQRIAKGSELIDIGGRGLGIARTRGAERAREVRDRVGMRKRGLAGPVSAAASAHAPRSSA